MPASRAVAEHLLDPARLVVEAEDHLVDLGHLLQQVDLVVEERPLENRDDRLRRVQRERAQARAFAPGEEDGLHATADHTCDRLCNRLHRSPSAERSGADESAERPRLVTRIFLVPLLVVVLLTKFEGHRVFGVPEGARRRGDLRPRVADRLARRLPGAPPRPDHRARPDDRSHRRQAADVAAFISLVQMDLAPAWMVAVIIGRELAVTGLRSFASHARAGVSGLAARQAEDGGAGGGDPAVDPRAERHAAVLQCSANRALGRGRHSHLSGLDYYRAYASTVTGP